LFTHLSSSCKRKTQSYNTTNSKGQKQATETCLRKLSFSGV
jgi:hypothetical protein